MRCCVLECKSDSERKDPDMSFHSFPDNEILRKRWIQSTGRTNWIPKKSSKICSKHFARNMVFKKNKFTFLHPDALPLLEIKTFMPSASTSVTSYGITMTDLMTDVDSKMETIRVKTSSCIHLKEEENMEANDDLYCEVNSDEEQSPEKDVKETFNDDNLLETKLLNYSPRTLQIKLKKSLKQSEERLKKLKALREKNRRLTKKVANLVNIIAELKAKSL